jgi:hypothetical protein
MGVLHKDLKDGHTFCPEGPGKQDEPSCFYCGVTITGKGVYWHGWASNWEKYSPENLDTNGVPLTAFRTPTACSSAIHLHYNCAQSFLLRLARDIWEVESQPQPVYDSVGEAKSSVFDGYCLVRHTSGS